MLAGLGPFIQDVIDTSLPPPNDGSLDISSETYSGITFDISSQSTSARDIVFSPLGEHMFITDNGSDTIYQYDFTTGYDLTTGSFVTSLSVNSEDNNPRGLAFNQDGTKMFMVGRQHNHVYEYDLTTPWDLSTASYANKNVSVVSQATGPEGIEFSHDGTTMLVCDNGTDTIYQYDLTTGYDISTASYSGNSLSIGGQGGGPTGIRSNSTGTVMVTIEFNTKRVHQYDLTTGYDVSTMSYSGNFFDVGAEDTLPTGLELNYFGDHVYIVSQGNDNVYQYDL